MNKAYNLSYIKYLLFLLVLYIYIYNPPFQIFSFYPKYILYPFAIVFFVWDKKFLNNLKSIQLLFFSLFLITLFSFFRDIFSFKFVFFPSNLLLLFEGTFLPLFIISFYNKVKPKGELLKEIVFIGVFAGLITLAMILNIELSNLIRYSILQTDDYTEFVAHRTFGLADGLTFSYGITQGFIFAIILYLSYNNRKYLPLLPIFLISILFNARIGFLPAVLMMLFWLYYNLNFKSIFVLSIFISGLFYVYNNSLLFDDYRNTIEWGFDFFVQISEFLSGKDKGEFNTFDTLFGSMAIFPKDLLSWIIGSGKNIFMAELSSDVGYIIQLNYGGLVYISLIFLFFIILIAYYSKINKVYKTIFFVIILSLILANIKGNSFGPSGNFRLLMLVSIYIILESNKIKISKDKLCRMSIT